jgi:hypothetical protein
MKQLGDNYYRLLLIFPTHSAPSHLITLINNPRLFTHVRESAVTVIAMDDVLFLLLPQ